MIADKMPLLNNIELKKSFEQELEDVLQYWISHAIDTKENGFYGEIDDDNQAVSGAVKGAVLNARILWSFAAAYNLTHKQKYLRIAGKAFRYIAKYFVDPEFGGVYWSLTAAGLPLDTKKQVYAQAFTVYGLSEYYKVTKNREALELAQNIYRHIENHSFDWKKGGYFEAFDREWKAIDDLRLSAKDANEKKTTNTHLHVLEAYTVLYEIWPNEKLEKQIRKLISNFEDHIINKENYHLILFFDEDWQVRSDTISYGHDIEAAWLLQRAAEVLDDEELLTRIKQLAVKIARQTARFQNPDGSINYEFEPSENKLITERHWWVQAEAMVGFYNAWQQSSDIVFQKNAFAAWEFTLKHIIDKDKGEWYWGVYENGSLMPGYGKAGFWKCPYHNSRACIEMIQRLEKENS